MIIPVRCFSCGKPVGHLWEEFKKRVQEGESAKQVFEDLDIEKFCCKSIFLGQTDLAELIGKFRKA